MNCQMKKNLLYVSIAVASWALFSCNNSEQSAEPAATETKTDSVTATTGPNVTDNWRIGVQLWTFREFPFVKAIDKVDSAGAKFNEAFPGQKLGGDFKNAVMDPSLSAENRTKVKELLKAKGINM